MRKKLFIAMFLLVLTVTSVASAENGGIIPPTSSANSDPLE